MRDRYFKAVIPGGVTPDEPWTRNPDWLPLDDVQPGDNKFSGLWAVYEDIPSTHFLSYQIGGAAVSEVDYGDGNTQTTSNLIIYEHQYDYATLAGPILVDPELGNYKMVVVNAQLTSVTSGLIFDRHGTQGYTANPLGWLDIIVNCQSMTTFNISSQRRSQYLERLRIVENSIIGHNSIFQFLSRLRILDLGLTETSNTSNFQSLFTYTNSNFTSSNNEPFSIINNVATNMVSTFNQAIGIKKIGTISSTSVTSISAIFTNDSSLEEIDKVLTPNVLNTANAFNECRNLKIINEIEVSGSTTASGMFSGCMNLTKIGDNNYLYLPDCTVGVNMFNTASSLKNITLHMPSLESMGTMFLRAASIEEITFEVPINNIANLVSTFQQCYELRKIDLSGSTIIGSIANAFNLSFNLQEVILGDCTNVNNTNGVFAGTLSLQKVRIPNIRLGFSLVNTAIEAPEMVVVFNDLADLIALGLPTQTIVITGTPAAVNLSLSERAIATDKGWTITG